MINCLLLSMFLRCLHEHHGLLRVFAAFAAVCDKKFGAFDVHRCRALDGFEQCTLVWLDPALDFQIFLRNRSRDVQEVWDASVKTCLVPFFHIGAPTLPSDPPNKYTPSKMNYLTYPRVTRHKRVVRDTTGFYFFLIGWKLLTSFIFHIRIVASLWRGQRLISLDCGKKYEKCCVWKCNQWTHMLLIW